MSRNMPTATRGRHRGVDVDLQRVGGLDVRDGRRVVFAVGLVVAVGEEREPVRSFLHILASL